MSPYEKPCRPTALFLFCFSCEENEEQQKKN